MEKGSKKVKNASKTVAYAGIGLEQHNAIVLRIKASAAYFKADFFANRHLNARRRANLEFVESIFVERKISICIGVGAQIVIGDHARRTAHVESPPSRVDVETRFYLKRPNVVGRCLLFERKTLITKEYHLRLLLGTIVIEADSGTQVTPQFVFGTDAGTGRVAAQIRKRKAHFGDAARSGLGVGAGEKCRKGKANKKGFEVEKTVRFHFGEKGLVVWFSRIAPLIHFEGQEVPEKEKSVRNGRVQVFGTKNGGAFQQFQTNRRSGNVFFNHFFSSKNRFP
jgi:hypothetical protein